MKFQRDETEKGLFVVRATPTDFDGTPPVSELRAVWNYVGQSSDRLAVGCTLVFGPWIMGVLQFPSEISALTAQRISEWFREVHRGWVNPTPVRSGGLKIPKGRDKLILHGSASDGLSARLVLPEAGTTLGANAAQIASNIAFLQSNVGATSPVLAEIGLAVIVAEDLGVNEIVVGDTKGLGERELEATAWMLESVALGLSRG